MVEYIEVEAGVNADGSSPWRTVIGVGRADTELPEAGVMIQWLVEFVGSPEYVQQQAIVLRPETALEVAELLAEAAHKIMGDPEYVAA